MRLIDAEPHWIPCSERLPEEDKDVLCKTLAEVMFVASYGKLHRWTDEKGWIITPSLERVGISSVDYWMPLPEFYKEGGGMIKDTETAKPDYEQICKEYKTKIDELSKQNDDMQVKILKMNYHIQRLEGRIEGLEFSIRCNGVSGGEITT